MPVHVVTKEVHFVGICYRLRYIARTVCASLSCHHTHVLAPFVAAFRPHLKHVILHIHKLI